MSIKKLTAENAIIKTASVEVKTLTISGKQVTLAVFRQLPIKDIISDESYDLLGMPWGRVNYSLPDKPHGKHVQLVWQEGQTLYRCWVTREFVDWQELRVEIKETSESLTSRYQMILIHALSEQVPIDLDLSSRIARFSLNNYSFQVYVRQNYSLNTNLDDYLARNERYTVKDVWDKETHLYIGREPRSEEELTKYRNGAIETYAQLTGGWKRADLDDWNDAWLCDELQKETNKRDGLCKQLEAYNKKWNEHYQVFESLDQLYIAV